ncbi:MAG: hypothetical protein ABIG39_01585 [Candidatus Micrarchaeota archaeon]
MTQKNEEEALYKSFQHGTEQAVVTDELKRQLLKFKDPVVLGSLFYSVMVERENSNRLLKNVLARLDVLEERIASIETGSRVSQRTPRSLPFPMLPEADERIVQIIREKGRVCAKEVRAALNYKGTNAASARMNKLFERGILEKEQVGRRVYYVLPNTN